MTRPDERFRLVDEGNTVIVGLPGPPGRSVQVTASEFPPYEPLMGDIWFEVIGEGPRTPHIYDGVEWLSLIGPPASEAVS